MILLTPQCHISFVGIFHRTDLDLEGGRRDILAVLYSDDQEILVCVNANDKELIVVALDWYNVFYF